MDTNISIGLGNGRMIFLLGGKNQEQRRVSASLKLATFIQITDKRKISAPSIGLHPNPTMNQQISPCCDWYLNRPFVSHVRNDEVLWDNNYNNKLAALALTNYTEPRTRNQEQRRVSASLKLAVFIQITENR